MKKFFWIPALFGMVALFSGCSGNHIHDISKVSIYSCSGPVSPEYQWEEVITITPEELTLTRTGSAEESKINTGNWTISVEEPEVEVLFSQLEEINYARIKVKWFIEERTGDGYKQYTINYGDDKTLTIENDLNKEYQNIDLISNPIRDFLIQQNIPGK